MAQLLLKPSVNRPKLKFRFQFPNIRPIHQTEKPPLAVAELVLLVVARERSGRMYHRPLTLCPPNKHSKSVLRPKPETRPTPENTPKPYKKHPQNRDPHILGPQFDPAPGMLGPRGLWVCPGLGTSGPGACFQGRRTYEDISLVISRAISPSVGL